MQQQTAVQWLKQQYIERGETLPSGVFQEALEMEKQQIIDAVGLKKTTGKDDFGNNKIVTLTPEEYYNKKYK